MAPSWTHLVRFIAKEDGQIHLGQIDASEYPDVGLATYEGKDVSAQVVNGDIYNGEVTDRVMHVQQLLPPIDMKDVPIIRCMGLNYRDHAIEAKLPIPTTPVLFIKPRTSINGPYPAKINVPKNCQDGSSDYESELTLIISKDCRDVKESEALNYVLGYTCGNDVSARNAQWANSQWSFSKGFDGAAPIGPVLVASSAIKDPHNLDIKGIHNGDVVQDSNTKEMIFNINQCIAFLSQGTTLERGTVIMTGTGPGIGAMRDPKVVLNDGDDMRVWIEGIGTLVNKVYYE